MWETRSSGIICHPTSLPGPRGIGEIGREARRFADLLAEMGQRLWQVLPLGPTGYGDSPYQSPSTFAGNPLLIDLEDLVDRGLLAPRRLRQFPSFPEGRVDYGAVIPERMKLLHGVCRTFSRRADPSLVEEFESFCHRQAHWLDDYALFQAIKDAHGGRSWMEWAEPLAQREPAALKRFARDRAGSVRHVRILQFLFHLQWRELRRYAHERGLRIIGDLPIFVAHDSSDVWAHPELFFLDDRGRPTVVAGVPPDYFSATGQLWGNPLYDWNAHEERGFDWWIARLRHVFDLNDIVRIDHFRGFEAYWEIPAGETTAVNGAWVKGPADKLFDALRAALGELPIIAEDLGVITREVDELRDRQGFPGMRVLQFAFGTDDKADEYKPHNIPDNCVVYTGTHDNDTTVGWFHSTEGADSTRTQEDIDRERELVLEYLGTDGSEIHWDMIRLALETRAHTAIVPLQDVLGLGSEARMNVPGREQGNWQWRFAWDQVTPEVVRHLAGISRESRRI